MAESTGSGGQDILSRVIARAWTNETFRQKLIEHPEATLREQFGIEVPEGTAVTVLQESKQHAYLVLPLRPDAIPQEGVSDQELADWAAHHTAHTFCTGSETYCL